MHNLQKPIVGTLVQGWTQNPCLAAGLYRLNTNSNLTKLGVDNFVGSMSHFGTQFWRTSHIVKHAHNAINQFPNYRLTALCKGSWCFHIRFWTCHETVLNTYVISRSNFRYCCNAITVLLYTHIYTDEQLHMMSNI